MSGLTKTKALQAGLVVLGTILGVWLSASAAAQDGGEPDAAAILQEALREAAEGARRVEYDLRKMDGHGGELRGELRVIRNRTAGGYASLAWFGDADEPFRWALVSVVSTDGTVRQHCLRDGRVSKVRGRRLQTAIGETDLWFEDFLDAPEFDETALVSGVILNGRNCWLIRGRRDARSIRHPAVEVWLRRDEPRVMQMQWLDRRGRFARLMKLTYETGEDGAAALSQVTCRDLAGGSWTELHVRSAREGPALDHGRFIPELLEDPAAMEALWR